MGRLQYTLKQAILHKSALQQFRHDKRYHLKTVLDLDAMLLKDLSVTVLALDFDGVLASHGEPVPRPEVIDWLKTVTQQFTGQVFILSNKPDSVREQFFAEHFPMIRFIKGVRKKPYPDGLLQIQKISQAKPEQIILVDDRLLTGVLAALSISSKAIWIRQPYADFKKHLRSECFFAFLRWLEKQLG